MEKTYKVVFVYPDGHVEEINEHFNNGHDALEYGNNLVAQVLNTEGVYHRSSYDDNEFGFKGPKQPHFMILEIYNNKYKMVYDSQYAE